MSLAINKILMRYLSAMNTSANLSNVSKTLPKSVKIVEVGPRDGLQNEKTQVPTEVKVKMVELLVDSGIKHIEITSFVSPKWVPQLSDSSLLCASIERKPNTLYSALTPNIQGYEAAVKAKVDQVAIFAAASEAFTKKNINCTIQESLERFEPVCKAAHADRIPVRGYVSCIVACPYEGRIGCEKVAYVARLVVSTTKYGQSHLKQY